MLQLKNALVNDRDIKVLQINFNENTWGKAKLIWSGLCMWSLRPLHRQAAQHFDERYKRKQTASQNIPFGSLGTELWEPNIYICVLFSESSIKFLQVTKLLQVSIFLYVLLYSHQYSLFFKYLSTEIVIFKNVCY